MKQKKLSKKSASSGYIQPKVFTQQASAYLNRLQVAVLNRPLGSFLLVLVALVLVAAVGSYWRRPQPIAEVEAAPPLVVPVLAIGNQPIISVPATIQKSGIVKVNAQSGGIVQKITVKPGQEVSRGQQLVSLSIGYAGGSPQNFQRQIAEKSYVANKDNLPLQLELIEKRRQIAKDAETQAAELRDISQDSIDDTKTLIELNEAILSTIEKQLTTLLAANDPSTAAEIQALQGSKVGVLSGLSALRGGLRATEYQSDDDEEPAKIATLSRDLTLKQLDLEERGAKLGLEIAELQFKLARFSESLLYPASPCSGTVERIYVQFGQSINPGNAIAEVVCKKTGTQAIGLTSEVVARKLLHSSDGVFLSADGATISAQILAVSTQPTDGPLFSVTALLADEESTMTDASFGVLELPIEGMQTSASVPFIPLDAMYQTQTKSFVYVVSEQDGKRTAALREVTLGSVFNASVEVVSGLQNGDQVILSRAVSAGDAVAIEE